MSFLCVSLHVCSLHVALHKMTTPLNLPVSDEDCVKLEEIEDHVSDGRWLFTPRLIRLNAAWVKLLLGRTRIRARRVKWDCRVIDRRAAAKCWWG